MLIGHTCRTDCSITIRPMFVIDDRFSVITIQHPLYTIYYAENLSSDKYTSFLITVIRSNVNLGVSVIIVNKHELKPSETQTFIYSNIDT